MSRDAVVLYAEDDENDVFFMERAFNRLQRQDQLHVVRNGAEVVHYLTGAGQFAERERFPQPRVIVLDVKMPGMSGLEALAWIRGRREFDVLPVVMFTSSTQEKDVAFSRRHGANAYLVKPSNADQLFRLVEKILAASDAAIQPTTRLAVEGNLI